MLRWLHASFRALAVAAAAASLATACRAADGYRIYERKCASCHGANGEGGADKYAEALAGDWSVARLTRYIAASMPEDDPETLTAAEAEAVSRYIHDAFYSREAQARLHPVRVELSHLTNAQYVTTVADLLRGFMEPDAETTGERGLTSTWYSTAQRGRFDSSKIVHRGTDRELDFEFTDTSAARERAGSAEFSVQWRGAVLAEETGDYEFNVRTPDSVRVWINADIMPASPGNAILDVNVSTPEAPDHRVTVRLIGGRRYPIAIDYWALPGKAGAPPPALSLRWKPPHGSERPIPARHLSPAAIQPTFVVATRFPADDSSEGYERGGAVSKAWDEATTSAALEVANHVGKRLDRLAAASPRDADRIQKLVTFAERFLAAVFRRPLSAAEKHRYVDARFETAPDPEIAVRRVVLFALKSPQFLYVELPVESNAAGVSPASPREPDPHTVASRLSFALWDSLPDAALAQAAAAGRLGTRAEMAAHAGRMLADSRARAKLREFFHHWLQIRFLEDLRKDPAAYPGFTPEIIDDLRTSLNLFLDEVVWSEASDFRELLRAEYMIANERLAKFYGLPAPPAGEFARIATAGEQRAGVLTHPYLLAASSYRSSTSPIHRGVFLTRNIVGRALKSPPVAATFNDTEFTPGMTMREKVATLTRSESCRGCHAIINPLGFSLEWYDAVGRFRTEENGRPIDAASEFLSDDHEPVRLTGPRDVAEFALASERAIHTFIERLFHHIVKQPIMAYGLKTAALLRDSFIASGYNLKKLLADIATVAAAHGLASPTDDNPIDSTLRSP